MHLVVVGLPPMTRTRASLTRWLFLFGRGIPRPAPAYNVGPTFVAPMVRAVATLPYANAGRTSRRFTDYGIKAIH